MMSVRTLAAATLAFGLFAAPVLAAEATTPAANVDTKATGSVSTGNDSNAASSSLNLGIDISGAGATTESRVAFFKTLSPQDQQMVTTRCGDANTAKAFTTEEVEFCKANIH
jgi:hypothetical protein